MALIDNLKEYWKLDEGTGNATGSVSSIVLTNNNTISYGTGKINNCADSGSSNTNKYLQATNNLGISTGTGSRTLAIWVNINTQPTTGQLRIMALHRTNGAGAGDSCDWSIRYQDSGGTKQLLFTFSGATQTIKTDNYTLTTGTWFHIAVVYDSVDSSMKTYVNGTALGGSVTRTASYGTGYGNAVTLFDNFGGSAFPTSAKMDEFGVWERALSASEVTSLYNSGNGLSYPFSVSSSQIKTWNGVANT